MALEAHYLKHYIIPSLRGARGPRSTSLLNVAIKRQSNPKRNARNNALHISSLRGFAEAIQKINSFKVHAHLIIRIKAPFSKGSCLRSRLRGCEIRINFDNPLTVPLALHGAPLAKGSHISDFKDIKALKYFGKFCNIQNY